MKIVVYYDWLLDESFSLQRHVQLKINPTFHFLAGIRFIGRLRHFEVVRLGSRCGQYEQEINVTK